MNRADKRVTFAICPASNEKASIAYVHDRAMNIFFRHFPFVDPQRGTAIAISGHLNLSKLARWDAGVATVQRHPTGLGVHRPDQRSFLVNKKCDRWRRRFGDVPARTGDLIGSDISFQGKCLQIIQRLVSQDFDGTAIENERSTVRIYGYLVVDFGRDTDFRSIEGGSCG